MPKANRVERRRNRAIAPYALEPDKGAGSVPFASRRAQSFYCATRASPNSPTVSTRPILRKEACRHVAVKRRERPIAYVRDEAMVHGIDVAIFNVCAARARGAWPRGFDLVGQKTAATIEEICREKPASSGDECAPVIWHAAG